MRTRTHCFMRVLLLLTALVCAIAGFAQGAPVDKAPTPKGPTAAQMKMRTMTQEQRRAAAQRNAERKAAYGRKDQAGRNAQQRVRK